MKLQFYPTGCLTDEEEVRNVTHSRNLGLRPARGSGRLALVGGGPSALKELETLRNWQGEVWAINGAAKWCHGQGIKATLVTLHPFIDVPDCVERVILGEECSPELFDKCRDRDLYVLTDKTASGQTVPRWCSTATAVAFMVPILGFFDVTFFGLEGSYGETSHNYEVYQDPDEFWLTVSANGETFRTKAEFLLQSQCLAELIFKYPIYEERSGGLLRALVSDHLYEVHDMAPKLRAQIEAEQHGDSTFHDRPQSAA